MSYLYQTDVALANELQSTSVQGGEMSKQEFYQWTVKIGVHPKWVADGFELDEVRAMDMVQELLDCAYEWEVSAEVVQGPDAAEIEAEQTGKPQLSPGGAVLAEPRLCACGDNWWGECPGCETSETEESDGR